jgi:hypothetical protein
VPQDSNLGCLSFNNFIKNVCVKIAFSDYLMFAGNLKLFRAAKSAKDCKLLQSVMNLVLKQCDEIYIKFNILEIHIIHFISRGNIIPFNHYVGDALII